MFSSLQLLLQGKQTFLRLFKVPFKMQTQIIQTQICAFLPTILLITYQYFIYSSHTPSPPNTHTFLMAQFSLSPRLQGVPIKVYYQSTPVLWAAAFCPVFLLSLYPRQKLRDPNENQLSSTVQETFIDNYYVIGNETLQEFIGQWIPNMFSVQFGKCYESTKKQSKGGAEIRNSFLDKGTPWKRS